jgi:hypothetical protein
MSDYVKVLIRIFYFYSAMLWAGRIGITYNNDSARMLYSKVISQQLKG